MLKNDCGGPSAVLRGVGSGRAVRSAAPMPAFAQTKFQRKLKLRLRALADRLEMGLRHNLKVGLR